MGSCAVVQIADFGLSRQLKVQTISTATYGTVRINSPSCLGSATHMTCLAATLLGSCHPRKGIPSATSSRGLCLLSALPSPDQLMLQQGGQRVHRR